MGTWDTETWGYGDRRDMGTRRYTEIWDRMTCGTWGHGGVEIHGDMETQVIEMGEHEDMSSMGTWGRGTHIHGDMGI